MFLRSKSRSKSENLILRFSENLIEIIFFVNFELLSWFCALKRAKKSLMIFKIVTMGFKVHPRSPEVTKIRKFRQILAMKWPPGSKFLPACENLTQRLYILIVWLCYQLFCNHNNVQITFGRHQFLKIKFCLKNFWNLKNPSDKI